MNKEENRIATLIAQALPTGPSVPPNNQPNFFQKKQWVVTAYHTYEPAPDANWGVTIKATVTKRRFREKYNIFVKTLGQDALYDHSVKPLANEIIKKLTKVK